MTTSHHPTKTGLRVVLLACAAIVAGCFLALVYGCPAGSVTTSTGLVVPASTVQAQDLVADGLDLLRTAHATACSVHDANAVTDDPAAHAKERQLLLDSGAGLRSAYGVLIAWKLSNGGTTTPATVLADLKPTAPALLDLLVRLKVLTADKAAQIRALIGA